MLRQMVKYRSSLDSIFSALSDPTRREILCRLAGGPRNVGELARNFDLSPSGFSKHLRVLERAGVMRQRKRGRERRCEVVPEALDGAITWLEQYRKMWTASLESFAKYVESLDAMKSGET